MFLDADVSLSRETRAAVLAASPCTAQVLEQILIDEVYPVCWANLNAANGESVAFDPDWLEAMILQQGPSPATLAAVAAARSAG